MKAQDVAPVVRRLATTARLAADEYRLGVSGGRVVLTAEVEEAKLFLLEARKATTGLTQPLGDSTSAELDRIILRCLGRKPTERYPDVRELARDLDQLLDGGDERTVVKKITTARMDVPTVEEPTLLNAMPKFVPASTLPGVGPPKKKR